MARISSVQPQSAAAETPFVNLKARESLSFTPRSLWAFQPVAWEQVITTRSVAVCSESRERKGREEPSVSMWSRGRGSTVQHCPRQEFREKDWCRHVGRFSGSEVSALAVVLRWSVQGDRRQEENLCLSWMFPVKCGISRRRNDTSLMGLV